MSEDFLQASLRAVRTAGDVDPSDLAGHTRMRVRRSLVRRARGRRRLMQSSLVVAVLLVSTLSWAVSTGRITLRSAPDPEPAMPAPERDDATTSMRLPEPQRAARSSSPEAWPVPTTPPPAEPPVEKAPEKPAEKPIIKPIGPRPTEVLYRKAHDLHFRGGDLAAALAAWDAYLAAESTGRFAIEARYNRALVLARLGRYAEARDALLPYARGEVAGGYRRAEATPLVERLEALNAIPRSGD